VLSLSSLVADIYDRASKYGHITKDGETEIKAQKGEMKNQSDSNIL
jgi:hypothetical protein